MYFWIMFGNNSQFCTINEGKFLRFQKCAVGFRDENDAYENCQPKLNKNYTSWEQKNCFVSFFLLFVSQISLSGSDIFFYFVVHRNIHAHFFLTIYFPNCRLRKKCMCAQVVSSNKKSYAGETHNLWRNLNSDDSAHVIFSACWLNSGR